MLPPLITTLQRTIIIRWNITMRAASTKTLSTMRLRLTSTARKLTNIRQFALSFPTARRARVAIVGLISAAISF